MGAREMPCGFESAVFRLDSAVRRDKCGPVCVFASGEGRPTVKFYEEDGSTVSLTIIDGEWRVLEGVS